MFTAIVLSLCFLVSCTPQMETFFDPASAAVYPPVLKFSSQTQTKTVRVVSAWNSSASVQYEGETSECNVIITATRGASHVDSILTFMQPGLITD